MEQPGILCSNITLQYGRKAAPTLTNMNMNIPKGAIYGLLGPSGCGKTSILRCILGRLKPSTGQISVFGHKPGTRQSRIPGAGVGYMPQEVALYNEFTIEETIYYFSTIFNLSKSVRKSRLEALLKFLDLPDKRKHIQTLSGGQKRRVSIAATLVHKPPLLILDEPTVGVDPLLRESIWKHLYELTQSEQMTIIITTHYVEEARQAHMIGLMRQGTLLVEDNPIRLLKKYSCTSLEDVFLKVCHLQEHLKFESDINDSNNNDANKQLDEESASLITNQKIELEEVKTQSLATKLAPTCQIFEMKHTKYDSPNNQHNNTVGKFSEFFIDNYNKVKSQIKKSVVKTQRNLGLIAFQICLPAITMFFFCLCIGNEIKGLNLAVYNGEVNTYNYSHDFFKNLKDREVNLIYYDSEDEAIDSVREGATWGALVVNGNYSYSLKDRIENYFQISNDSLAQSSIKYYADQSEMPVQFQFGKYLLESVVDFLPKVVKHILPEMDPAVLSTPLLESMKPVFGDSSISFRDYIAPALVLAITYAMSVGLTALAFVQERKEGLLERSLVSGVLSIHIFFAHFIVEFVMMLLQTVIMLIFIFNIFGVSINGSLTLVILLTLVQGVCGMSFGMLISAICHDEQSAIMLTIGMFYPTLITSGIIWPTDGMPQIMNKAVYLLPQTFSVKAIRAIITKDWGLTHPIVLYGFLSSFAWIILFNWLALIVFKRK